MLEQLMKSVLDQDDAPVVICDMESVIMYMNPAAVARYKKDLTGQNLRNCHSPEANKAIERVLAWFGKSRENNVVYTFRNEQENKDVYMVALRDREGCLIGYYEKHAFRTRETGPLYEMKP